MNPETIGAYSLGFAVAGSLITFGIMYGTLKKEQESFKEAFKEFKQEIKNDIKTVHREIKAISDRCYYHNAPRIRDEEPD